MKYIVWMRSKPGMYEQYNGKVEVWAKNEKEAIENAHAKLRRGAFPDRNSGMWNIDKIECIGT